MKSCVIILLGAAICCITPGHGWSGLNIIEERPKPIYTTPPQGDRETEAQHFHFQFTTMYPSLGESEESQIKNIDALYESINKEEYGMALHLSKQLKFPEDCDNVKSVVLRMLRDANERIMKYAYIFKKEWSDKNIIKNCFPDVFQAIMSEKQARIVSQDLVGVLVLSTNRDHWQDRWLLTESAYINRTSGEDLWFFREPQHKCVSDDHYLEIRNRHHGMSIKLDVNTQNQGSSRWAWGDERPNDERYNWKIVPAGMDAYDEPLFCFVDKVYKHTLKPISNLVNNNKMSGVQKPCDPSMAWIIKTN